MMKVLRQRRGKRDKRAAPAAYNTGAAFLHYLD
jgi:hypothetical protein